MVFLGGRGEKRVEGFFSIPKGCFLGDMGRWEVWLFWEDGAKKDLSKYAKLLRR